MKSRIKIQEYLSRHISFRTFIILFAVANTLLFATLSVTLYQQVQQQYFKHIYTKFLSQTRQTDTIFAQLSVEHTSLEVIAISATIQNTPDQAAAAEKLSKHSRAYASYIGELYDPGKEQAIFDLLKSYDTALLKYAQATREQNTTEQSEALSVLSGYPKKIAHFYSELGGKVSNPVLQYAYSEYVATIKTILDAYQVKDYQGAFTKREQALSQIKNAAHYLESQLFEEKK